MQSSIEAELNAAKDLLSRPDFETLKRNDPWEYEIRNLRKHATRQSNGQGVTKAWLKCYEMLSLPPIKDKLLSLDSVKIFFNAELPGGFVFATNHFLKTHGKKMEWLIASYYPKDQIIVNNNLVGSGQTTFGTDYLGDSLGLIKGNPTNSLVGIVNTNRGQFWSDGNLLNPKMVAILSQLVLSKLGKVDLYTADGGFNVEGRESLQEELSYPLIVGEVEAGLRTLADGGIMILKLFTFFRPETLGLIQLLIPLFELSDLYKPQTSGPLNSEIYFIGIGFRGASDAIIASLRLKLQDITPSNTLIERSNQFAITQIKNIRGFVEGQQIDASGLKNIFKDVTPLSESDKLPTA